MRAAASFVRRTVRAVRLVIRDQRIPRPLRWLGGLALLPIPGPFDEAVLLLLAAVLVVLYRGPMRDAWRQAAVTGSSASGIRPAARSSDSIQA